MPVASDATIRSLPHGVVSAHGSPSRSVRVHVEAPPVGSVEVNTCPLSSVATHSVVDAHETDSRLPPLSIVACVQLPDAGSVVRSSAPLRPTATQRDADGQATLTRLSAIDCFVHEPAPGSVVVAIC
jgi:hypothetical protein